MKCLESLIDSTNPFTFYDLHIQIWTIFLQFKDKKNWVKKEPSEVGNHWHNTIVLLDIEELT